MYEKRSEPLLPMAKFLVRWLYHAGFALGIVVFSLGIGMVGYHTFEGLSWIDALLNSSMLLGGMGPVNPIQTNAGKVFASFYALYSGIIFLLVAGVLFTPVYHRFLHRFHLAAEDEVRS